MSCFEGVLGWMYSGTSIASIASRIGQKSASSK
jgi:hypothetical protein